MKGVEHVKELKLNVARTAMRYGIHNQRKIAAAAGISKTTMNDYWNGKVERVDLLTLSKIAAFLQCDPAELLVTVEVKEDAEDAKSVA